MARRTSFSEMNCSIARTLEVVGEWWTMLIVRDAFLGVRRFEDFQRRLGIARNVLTVRLDRLVAEGVLERYRYQDRPERHEYRLTEKGIDLYPVVVSLMRWGDRWAAPAGGPPVVLVHDGHDASPVLACERCGEELAPRQVTPRPGPGAVEGQVPPRRRPGVPHGGPVLKNA